MIVSILQDEEEENNPPPQNGGQKQKMSRRKKIALGAGGGLTAVLGILLFIFRQAIFFGGDAQVATTPVNWEQWQKFAIVTVVAVVLVLAIYFIYRRFKTEEQSFAGFWADTALSLQASYGLYLTLTITAFSLFLVSVFFRFSGPDLLKPLGIGWVLFMVLGFLFLVLTVFGGRGESEEVVETDNETEGDETDAEDENLPRPPMKIRTVFALCVSIGAVLLFLAYVIRQASS